MPGFIGGSALAMVSQIGEGYFLVNLNSFKGWVKGDLQLLRAELDKALRDIRSTVPPADDAQLNQARNRKIVRFSSALQVVHAATSARARG